MEDKEVYKGWSKRDSFGEKKWLEEFQIKHNQTWEIARNKQIMIILVK